MRKTPNLKDHQLMQLFTRLRVLRVNPKRAKQLVWLLLLVFREREEEEEGAAGRVSARLLFASYSAPVSSFLLCLSVKAGDWGVEEKGGGLHDR